MIEEYRQTMQSRVFHNNTFFPDDFGDLGIIDHTHDTHSDFLLEFLEVIFIAAWRNRQYTAESGRSSSQNALTLPIIAHLVSMTPLFLRFLTRGSRF